MRRLINALFVDALIFTKGATGASQQVGDLIGQVVDRIEDDGARDLARAWVAEKLRGLT